VLKLPRLSRARVVIILAAALVGYVAFTAVGDSLVTQRLSREEQQVRQEIDDLVDQQRQLEAIRDYLQTGEYIERVARRVLGLVRPGETLVVVTSSAEAPPEPTPQAGEEEAQPWWERLYGP
jgi:cell division protein FtsB